MLLLLFNTHLITPTIQTPFNGTECINVVALRGKMLNVSSYGEKGSWRKEHFSALSSLLYLCNLHRPVEQSSHLILPTYQAASKKWTDRKAALTKYFMLGNLLAPLSKFSFWAEIGISRRMLVSHAQSSRVYATAPPKQKGKKKFFFISRISSYRTK